ncbi:MAG: SusC/RagA family TonB-linked outer membrane protein [Gemmatimonadaceae bacterium]|nr:SusC/RagA family TonB-linked outer membrane protein [Gemmatimonadaceae bacterium]
MTSAARVRNRIAPLVALALAVFTAGAAHAQTTISGRVTNTSGAGLPGANVYISTLNIGAQARENGAFTLAVPAAQSQGQSVQLSVRFIGYRPQSRPVTLTAGAQTVNFTLEADPFRLDEVVVTGVAEATSSRKLTFSVAKVSEEQLKEVPASSPIAALAGKVAGARVSMSRGNPGAAPTIRLRGSTSLQVGGSTPLIIVDGVITRSSLADIDANDIESIEVLKGAAASSYYGSDAANGVVQITTKRGRNYADNKVSWSTANEYGRSNVQRFPALNQSHIYETNPDGNIRLVNGSRVVKADQIADAPYPTSGEKRFRNQLQEWLTEGEFYSTNVQLGLRRGNTNFNTSFTNDRNEGIMPLTSGQYRQNLRMNVDQGLGTKADFSVSATYGLNKNDYPPGGVGSWFQLMQAPPDVNLEQPFGTADSARFYPKLPNEFGGSARANPLYNLANDDYKLRRERILGSFSLRYRPTDWLRLESSYGTDRLNQRVSDYFARGLLTDGGTPGQGSLFKSTANNVGANAQINATATKMWFENTLSTTRVAYLVEREDNSFFSANSSKLNVTATPDLGAGDRTQLSVDSQEIQTRTINYMVSQDFDIKDRYLFSGLYRRDGSSLFGSDNRWADFYRISGAYRISEDFQMPGIQELKIRAAQGTAGLRPGYFYQYETYSLGAGSLGKANLGNNALKPSVLTELEYGVNVAFLDRFDLELVRADRETKDAFLLVPLSLAASGGFANQWQNAATIESNTTELALNTRVIDRPDWSYNFTLTGDKTKQQIVSMNRAAFRVNAEGRQNQDVFYYKAGEPLGLIYGTKWVRSFDELPATADRSLYTINPAGYVVLASRRGKVNEAPIAFVGADGGTQHAIGDVNPDFSFGFANNLRWKAFNVYALFDGQQGGDIYNFTKQWMFQDHRAGELDQRGVAQEDKIPQPFFSSASTTAWWRTATSSRMARS